VAHHLACLGSRHREAHAVDDVVEAKLQHSQQVLAGHARRRTGRLEVALELALEDAVDAADLLLLAKLHAVVANLAAADAVLPGRRLAALERALLGIAARALEEELGALPAAQPADRIGVTGHLSSS
jgi:hypothetical protein